MLLAFSVSGDISSDQIIGNLLFAANLPPSTLIPPGAHFWILCIEVQFYLTIALLVAIGGRRSLLVIPTICITITLARIYWQQPMSIATWFRIDRSEEHTSELQSLMRISYAVFCLKKKKNIITT